MELNVLFLFILYLWTQYVICHSKNSYINHTIEQDSVCYSNSIKIREFSLSREDRSGLIMSHSSNSKNWTGTHPFKCKFTVRASFSSMGVFAVIQKMSLRKKDNPTGNSDCIDFIQFRQSNKGIIPGFDIGLRGNEWGNKLCGELDKFEKPSSDKPSSSEGEESLSPSAFSVEPSKGIDVLLNVAPIKLQPNETIDIEIAFTSYSRCRQEGGAEKLCGNSKCIYKDYFNDNIINCPYQSCLDEPSCRVINDDGPDSRSLMNTRVMVTAATSIFLSFFLFLGCIWLCRYLELLCWSVGGGVGSSGARGGSVVLGGVELDPPSPPPPSDHDPLKDPPPAYEDLFPGGAPTHNDNDNDR